MREKVKLQVGDEMFLERWAYPNTKKLTLGKVTRVTPTQAIVETPDNQYRYRREHIDGQVSIVEAGWRGPEMYFPTEALWSEYKHQNLVNEARRLCSPENLKSYSDEVLETIIKAASASSLEKKGTP